MTAIFDFKPAGWARRLPALALLLASSTTSLAGAAEPTRGMLSHEAQADQLFHSGQKKFDGGDYAGACHDLSESLKLGPKLGTLLNLALCHETTGKLVTAWSEFTYAAAWAAQNNQRDRLEFATQHVRSLEGRLPRIVLQLPASRAVESIDLDGEPVPEQRWYLPLYLDPGEHHIAVSAPGKKRTTVGFRVSSSPADQIVMIPPLLDDAPPPRTGPQLAAPKVDPTRRLLGLAGLGLGAAGLVTGTTLGALAAGADSRGEANDLAAAATIAFVGSGVFAATGGWLVWTSTPRGPRAAIAPAPNSLSVTGSF